MDIYNDMFETPSSLTLLVRTPPNEMDCDTMGRLIEQNYYTKKRSWCGTNLCRMKMSISGKAGYRHSLDSFVILCYRVSFTYIYIITERAWLKRDIMQDVNEGICLLPTILLCNISLHWRLCCLQNGGHYFSTWMS